MDTHTQLKSKPTIHQYIYIYIIFYTTVNSTCQVYTDRSFFKSVTSKFKKNKMWISKTVQLCFSYTSKVKSMDRMGCSSLNHCLLDPLQTPSHFVALELAQELQGEDGELAVAGRRSDGDVSHIFTPCHDRTQQIGEQTQRWAACQSKLFLGFPHLMLLPLRNMSPLLCVFDFHCQDHKTQVLSFFFPCFPSNKVQNIVSLTWSTSLIHRQGEGAGSCQQWNKGLKNDGTNER